MRTSIHTLSRTGAHWYAAHPEHRTNYFSASSALLTQNMKRVSWLHFNHLFPCCSYIVAMLSYYFMCHEQDSELSGPHKTKFLLMNLHTNMSLYTQVQHTRCFVYINSILLVYVTGLHRNDCLPLRWWLLDLSSSVVFIFKLIV